MKRKPKIPLCEDTRQIAIYTRKSRITHKGDSIGVQKKQCEDYAKCQLDLPDNYEYAYYENLGGAHRIPRDVITYLVCLCPTILFSTGWVGAIIFGKKKEARIP